MSDVMMPLERGMTPERALRIALQEEAMERSACPNCSDHTADVPLIQVDCSLRVCRRCGFEHHGSFEEVPS